MAKSDTSKKIADEVLEYISKTDPECFQKIDEAAGMKDELLSVAKKTAEVELKLQEDLKKHNGDITKLGLSLNELTDIKEGLRMATFRVHIDNKKATLTHLDGVNFKVIPLDSESGLNDAQRAQIASIVIEIDLLVLNIIGVKVTIPEATIEKATSWVENEYATNTTFRLAVDTFIKAWKAAPMDDKAKAKAIFELLKEMHKLGLFWKLTKLLLSNLSTTEWLKIAAKVTAQLIVVFGSDGIALIAKIALAIDSAYEFDKKLANLQIISDMRAN